MAAEVMVCTVTNEGGDYRAVITPAVRGRSEVSLRVGSAATIDGAIGKAISRPGVRFATAGDELDAEIAAFRGRSFTVMARNDELCHLGLR